MTGVSQDAETGAASFWDSSPHVWRPSVVHLFGSLLPTSKNADESRRSSHP